MSAQQDAVVAGPTTVPELLARRALLEPERSAIDTVGGESVTFGSWQARSAAVAGALLNRGLRPGDPVVLVFAGVEWTGYAVAFCGVLRAGGVAVPCSRRLPPARLAHLVRDSGAVLVLHSGGTTADASSLPELLADVPSTTLAELESAGTGGEAVPMSPHDPAQILYTSGTTGVPKGVCATHANLTYDATSRRQRQRPLAHSTHFLHSFPIGTNAGQTMLLNALDAHPTAVVLPRFSPNRFARLIEERRIGSVFVVPAMAAELVRSPALANRDLSGVRLVGSTAAPLPPAVAVALTRAFPAARLVNYYTSTEAAPAQTAMAFDPRRPDALGRTVGGALMIADPDGRPVPPGQVGEVWLRAPFPRHYLADGSTGSGVNGADAAGGARGAGRRAGWVRMGDLGRLDEAGYLYLVDRRHDIVNSGAHKVSTLQVEAAAHEHSDVADAAAVALPHPVLGSVVGLAVVPRPGTPADRLSLAVLRAHLRGRLADHELPARLVVLDRLPRNEAGKVAKTELPPLFPDATGGRDHPDATGGRDHPDATGGRGYPDGAASTAE